MLIALRPLAADDLDALFEQYSDRQSVEMAGIPLRDRPAFDELWARLMADPELAFWAITADGEIVGNIGFFHPGEVGYLIAREWWGRGIASQALGLFLAEVPGDLTAEVRPANVGSLRVLERNGFVETGRDELVHLVLQRSPTLGR